MSLLIYDARVVTLPGDPAHRRGLLTGGLGVLDRGWVRVEGPRIAEVGGGDPPGAEPGETVVDARGRVLMPAFVDCHTHLCWMGDRLDEWDARLRGATYLDILRAGGGILATVRAVRAATEEELALALLGRLQHLLREGTTTVEIKSGYGLSTESELKMLRAIALAGSRWPGTVVPTACIGHAIDPDASDEAARAAFIARTIGETLPAVTAEFPGIAVDAYCEEGAWRPDECLGLLARAQAAGHPIRVHADQFHALGLTAEAARRGFLSVDHLEASAPADLRALAASDSFAVLLPCCGLHADGRYADGRTLLDAGARLAIATNTNPGSSPCSSMPMAIALAARHNRLSPHEALACATSTPAALLGLDDRGRIAPGLRADLILLRHRDERALAFEFGGNPVDLVVCAGTIRSSSAPV
ncbi:MAG TPA: imidazolonepropionase [Phycisphaerales bacterium]|nr:imidazolonepropionase [Phycisphaerales bacterium]